MRFSILRNLLLSATLTLFAGQAPAVAGPFDDLRTENAATFSDFQKIYIAPVEVDLAEEKFRRNVRDINSDRPTSQIDQERRARDSYKHMVRAFGKKFALVDTPGSDVLTVETTITRIVSTRPTLEDQRTLNSRVDFSSIYAGGGDFKVRLSQGDTLFAEIEDRHQTNLNDGRPRVGIWQDYDRVSRHFSRKLAKYVSNN